MNELIERIWRGETPMDAWTQAVSGGLCTEVADGIAAISTSYFFGNVTAIRTTQGLVLVDTGSRETAEQTMAALRRWDKGPVHTVIYTHGHIDHTWGVKLLDAEADLNGWNRPHVIAHRNVLNRFERYDHTQALNSLVMGRQFNRPDYVFPDQHRRPDEVYDDTHTLHIGGVDIELAHGQGETDDATYVWIPAQSVLISGDFVIWAFPNAGNPRKVQRYAPHWAAALRKMHALQPAIIIPGHGPVLSGREKAAQLLDDGATILECLIAETLGLMNQGVALNEILHRVRAPAELLGKPYLLPVYDDPEFVVRGIWHLYAGWYDGNPAHLKPALDRSLATEIAVMAGGADALAVRALDVALSGDLRLAAQLIEFAVMAEPENTGVHLQRAAIYGRMALAETSLIGRALFAIPERESRGIVKSDD